MDCTNEKYSCPSSVNVADFVTMRPQLTDEVKLRSNFNLWKEQMLCLLKSQDVVGFINGETKEPQSDEQKLWRRSDSLVKGWILGSIGADVLQYVCVLETAREVWLELDYIFNFVFSTKRDFKMKPSNLWPSSVNVAKFVTVRPQLNVEERSRNFKLWKEQMLCLLNSQDVVGFIEGKMVESQQADEQKLWRSTDRLVKGWILGSIGADVLKYVCELETSREVWLELDYIFNFVFSAERGFEMKYRNLWPSAANVAKFVTVRPQLNEEEEERSRNFNLWKEQMLRLLKSQDVVDFIEGEIVGPQSDEQKLWGITDRLVKGWILGSIGTDVLQYVWELETAREVWLELDYIFNFVFSAEGVFEMKDSYLWPSSVNVAKFVTVRPQLNEEERSMKFNIWKEQMLCLLMRQNVVNFINGDFVETWADEQELWRIPDRLVKLWILGSIGADVLQKVCYLKTAREVWLKLEKIFNDDEEIDSNSTTDQEIDSNSTTDQGFETASKVRTDYTPLLKAAISGDWKTAKELFFEKRREDSEAVITEHGETALHVAVRSKRASVFVWNLVQKMRTEALAIRNKDGKTALHEAAIVGNTKAARAMLEKNPDLLYMMDDQFSMAPDYAAFYGQKETLEYLISVSNPILGKCPFEYLLSGIILCEFMDVALDLVKKFPDLARLRDPVDNTCALSVMATKDSLFESGENFNWWEKLIYRCVPVKQSESWPTFAACDIEAQTYRNSFSIMNRVAKWCKSMIWKVIELLVPGMKDIIDKKDLHNQALDLVKYLCHEMRYLHTEDARSMLEDSIMRAAEHGISEIVEVIMGMYPALTNCVNDEGWTIMHVAVNWRYEDVFNVIYKMIDRKHMFFNRRDNMGNSLLHLCARLPAPERLNIVMGAALQMQRELQWFNEMERFIPISCRIAKNDNGKTAKELFTEEHQELRELGEKWMKDTAASCSIATTLVATVVFAGSFNVPGGVSSETGIPVFFEEPVFVLFATTNAVSLLTSITSLFLFLSIFISRYAQQDFLYVLPKRLSFGLLTLFISFTFMMVAFSAAHYLSFRTKPVWFIIPVTTFGWLVVASFVRLQFPLLLDFVCSTFGHGIFSKKQLIFY